MKLISTALILLTFAGAAFSQSGRSQNVQSSTTLQNYVQYNEKNLSITAPNGEITYKSMRDLDTQLEKAVKHYMNGEYREAFPLLAELSQWGVKRAQMLLGDMYIAGRHVEQSTVRGLAWLGVANEVKTEKQAKKIYNHVYKQLDDDQQKYVDGVVASFIQRYGVDAQNYRCKKRYTVGTNIAQTECKKIPNTNSQLHPIS